jgi:hypothetical protein
MYRTFVRFHVHLSKHAFEFLLIGLEYLTTLVVAEKWIPTSRQSRSLQGVLKNAAVPAPELPAFVAEATSAE